MLRFVPYTLDRLPDLKREIHTKVRIAKIVTGHLSLIRPFNQYAINGTAMENAY